MFQCIFKIIQWIEQNNYVFGKQMKSLFYESVLSFFLGGIKVRRPFVISSCTPLGAKKGQVIFKFEILDFFYILYITKGNTKKYSQNYIRKIKMMIRPSVLYRQIDTLRIEEQSNPIPVQQNLESKKIRLEGGHTQYNQHPHHPHHYSIFNYILRSIECFLLATQCSTE